MVTYEKIQTRFPVWFWRPCSFAKGHSSLSVWEFYDLVTFGVAQVIKYYLNPINTFVSMHYKRDLASHVRYMLLSMLCLWNIWPLGWKSFFSNSDLPKNNQSNKSFKKYEDMCSIDKSMLNRIEITLLFILMLAMEEYVKIQTWFMVWCWTGCSFA